MTDKQILFTDIHSHIIYGVDDGAADIRESMEMLKIAGKQGIGRIVLTPHYLSEGNRYKPDELEERYTELRIRAAAEFGDIELYLGNEVMFSYRTIHDLRQGKIHTINDSRYVLIEYLPDIALQMMHQSIRDIQRIGLFPIIAHVERYSCLYGSESEIADLRDMGAYLQINTNSLQRKGIFDRRVKWCRKLITDGLISFLGTDSHGVSQRTPECAPALEWLSDILEPDEYYNIMYGNADMMLHDEIL